MFYKQFLQNALLHLFQPKSLENFFYQLRDDADGAASFLERLQFAQLRQQHELLRRALASGPTLSSGEADALLAAGMASRSSAQARQHAQRQQWQDDDALTLTGAGDDAGGGGGGEDGAGRGNEQVAREAVRAAMQGRRR